MTNLVEQLNSYGIRVIREGGRGRVTLPWPVNQAPAEVIPLLRKLKQAAAEPWDESEAIKLLDSVLERLPGQYPSGAILWANENRPELTEAIHGAALRYREAFQNQNLAGCRQAVAEYEQAVMNLYITFKEAVTCPT